MRRELSLSFLIFGLAAPSVLQADDSPARQARRPALQVITRVPLQIRDSSVRLDVMVNGQGPFPFGLDTGASQAALVTEALVESLNLPVEDRFRISDGSGINSRNANGAQIDSLEIGDVTFDRILAPVFGDGPKEGGDSEVYGTLGFDLFRDYVVTFDFPGRQLRIATGRLPKPDGRATLGYTLDRGMPRIPIRIGGLTLDASIDTGGAGAFLLPLPLADRLPLRTPLRPSGRIASILNEVDLYRSELDGDVHIGETTLHNPVLLFSELAQEPNIGRDALHRYAITFDQRNLRVRFQGSSQGGEGR